MLDNRTIYSPCRMVDWVETKKYRTADELKDLNVKVGNIVVNMNELNSACEKLVETDTKFIEMDNYYLVYSGQSMSVETGTCFKVMDKQDKDKLLMVVCKFTGTFKDYAGLSTLYIPCVYNVEISKTGAKLTATSEEGMKALKRGADINDLNAFNELGVDEDLYSESAEDERYEGVLVKLSDTSDGELSDFGLFAAGLHDVEYVKKDGDFLKHCDEYNLFAYFVFNLIGFEECDMLEGSYDIDLEDYEDE